MSQEVKEIIEYTKLKDGGSIICMDLDGKSYVYDRSIATRRSGKKSILYHDKKGGKKAIGRFKLKFVSEWIDNRKPVYDTIIINQK